MQSKCEREQLRIVLAYILIEGGGVGGKKKDNEEIYFPFSLIRFMKCYLYLSFMETCFF